MVKNTKGGHHKNQARKNSYSNSFKTRISTNDSEVYAKVIKIFGNQFDAITINGDTFRVIIRGKFSGKFKRSNLIYINSFVLIGIRNWSNLLIADLLEIYSNNDLSSLPSNPFFDSLFSISDSHFISSSTPPSDSFDLSSFDLSSNDLSSNDILSIFDI